jgi:ribosomal protein L18
VPFPTLPRVAACLLGAATVVLLLVAPPVRATGEAACVGAAARDHAHACAGSSLSRTVQPTPDQAEAAPSAPCTSVAREGEIGVCAFGVDPTQATRTVALVGDSHAAHWRAAVDVVAQAHGWRGLSITHSACPFSRARRNLLRPDDRLHCRRWNDQLLAWFRRHPEVDTMFISALSGGRGVIVARGRNEFAARVRGYLAAWRALPASVKHIVLIRDTPKVHADTLGCVRRAIAAHRPAGTACAVSRQGRLDRDAAVAAADRLHSRRVQTVDLTRYFCAPHRCFPVVGGILAFRDSHHLTPTFVRTVGPFLDRHVRRLMASW